MSPMPIEDALRRCVSASLGADTELAYTAACAVICEVYMPHYERRLGLMRTVHHYLPPEEWTVWSAQSVRENCAYALKKYGEAYGTITP